MYSFIFAEVLGRDPDYVFNTYLKKFLRDNELDMRVQDVLSVVREAGGNYNLIWKGEGKRAHRPNMSKMAKQFKAEFPEDSFLIFNATAHVIGIKNGHIQDTQPISSLTRYPTDYIFKITDL